MALDQGTTGTRAIIYDRSSEPVAQAYRSVPQYYPRPGWVEQDLDEIYLSSRAVIQECLERSGLEPKRIAGLGIANQRETVAVWDARTGTPWGRAIGWQCRRSATICREWQRSGLEPLVRERTGLGLDPYFSASKLRWLLEEHPRIRRVSTRHRLQCGTMDSWLLWKLTAGRVHATDVTNAARTMVFDIHRRRWDPELLEALGLSGGVAFPRVQNSGSVFGRVGPGQPLSEGTPILAIMGDQQAALYGQTAFRENDAKVTYGTGCFLLVNRGTRPELPSRDYVLTLAADAEGKPIYAWEGSVFHAGSALQWLRDEVGLLSGTEESEELAREAGDTGGVYLVPAFTGLGAPYWAPSVRGAITGITRGTTRQQLVRAGLEAIAYQVTDLFERMKADAGDPALRLLRVDGGASRNDFLMQFQSDMLQVPLERPRDLEVTARGVALLAGRVQDWWSNEEELRSRWQAERVFVPEMEPKERDRLYRGWKTAVRNLISWGSAPRKDREGLHRDQEGESNHAL
jgi:glycerol kinase